MALIEKEKDQLNSSLSLHREPLRFAADETVRIDHINQLLAFIGRLNWDTNGIEIEENERPISEEFLPLYQSISLIKQDFDGILQEKTSAQKQLKQSEKKYRTIIESINDGYYEVDLHGKITFCNHALSKLLGVSKKKLAGMNFRQFANRKNYVKIVQYFKHFYETGESESVLEWELEKKDGKKIFVDTSVSLIQDNESKPQGFRGMVRDITDRIQSENKILETSKDLENLNDELEVAIERSNKMVAESAMAYLELDQIFRASTEGIWVVSQSFDIFRINKMLLSIIGKTQEEIKGKKCYEVFPNPLCHTNECPVCYIIENCEPRMERDFEICLGKDVIIQFIMSAFPFRDVENETIGVVIGLKDITERKNAEALHGEKIKAEAENIAKSEFLANISHEMRTPLNGVIGMAELIQKTKLDDNQKNIFDTIVNEARALIGIINNVLDFSKIEAGKFELENIGFELGYLIEDISKSIAVRAQQRKLELISYIAPDLPRWLLGDPGRLRQILMNLAGNALKFTRKGEILITAQKQKDLGETVAILFSIKDTGIGIPLDKQKSIFNSFTKVDGSITRKYGGTGLGTTISKQLVELMGGKIGFKSQEGKGSNFSFVLEFKKYKNLNIKQGVESVKLRSLRILIATGNKRIGDVQSRYLKTWGCHPFWVKTGEESLQSLQNAILEDRPFDIAIIDTLLAEMTGFELAEDIRKTNSIKSIPIVLMTSVGWIGDGKLCKYLNINGYLTKHVGMEDLKKTIKLALGLLKKEKTGKSTPLITRHTIAETQEKDIQILLAEDYPTNQQVVLGYLSDSGYKVDLAENGLEAVNMYKAKAYDIVLMDIQMPVMGGFEATKLIREYEEISGKRTPIVAMTAHAMGGYKQLCLDTGMDDYISKPLLNKDFFAVLDKWTRGDDNYKKVKNDLSGTTIPDNIRIELSDQISDLPGVFKSEFSDHSPMNYKKALLEFMG